VATCKVTIYMINFLHLYLCNKKIRVKIWD